MTSSVIYIYPNVSTLYTQKTGYPVETLPSLMKRHGHSRVDVVRLDVESAEWDVLDSWLQSGTFSVIGQLLIEVHMWRTGPGAPANPGNRPMRAGPAQEARFSRILSEVPMRLFHASRNQWNNFMVYRDGRNRTLTQCYELGFVK